MPCCAEMRCGSSKPSSRISCAKCRSLGESALLAATTTLRPDRRSSGAMSRSTGVRPWRTSSSRTMTCGLVDRDLGLGLDRRARLVLGGVQVEAGRVDDRELAPAPLGDPVEPVARQPRLRVDDRLAPAEDAVEQRRFADVGATDDGDDGSRHASIRRRWAAWQPTGRQRGRSAHRMAPKPSAAAGLDERPQRARGDARRQIAPPR